MAIFGLTHSNDGKVVQRLSVSTKVAVGLGPDDKAGRKAPVKLDHFIFLKKVTNSGKDSDWVIDEELTKHYGPKPRSIGIILLSDEIEEVFPTQYAWWTKSKCLCRGDGLDAMRRTEDGNGDFAPWHPCGKECPDLEAGRCKPSGDLRFTLADFPQLGSVSRIHTSSYRSIMQVSSALHQVQLITGGRLCGIKGDLVVRMEKSSYKDDKGILRNTIIPAISVEIRASGMRKLIEGMTDSARVFEQTRKMLGSGHIQVIEGEEVAEELSSEFYHDREEPDPEPYHARKQRERGTLEPSAQQNRGHGNEGLSRSEETKAAATEEKPKAAAKKKEAKKPQSVTVEIARVEPRQTRLKPSQIEENEALAAKGEAPKHEPNPFFRLHCGEVVLYVFDKHLFKPIIPSANKKATFMCVEGKDGATITEIVEIAGVKYARDPVTKDAVPVDSIAATETKEPELFTVSGDVIDASGPFKKNMDYVVAEFLDMETDKTVDPHAMFTCIIPELFDLVLSCKGHNCQFVYSKNREGKNGTVWQMIQDVTRIGEVPYKEGKPEEPEK